MQREDRIALATLTLGVGATVVGTALPLAYPTTPAIVWKAILFCGVGISALSVGYLVYDFWPWRLRSRSQQREALRANDRARLEALVSEHLTSFCHTSSMAEFRINRYKVIEAIVYLASKRPRIDVFHMAKVLFYADMNHLIRYGRPILGDTYCAMDDGPVPSFALNVAKRNSRFVSDELLRIASEKLATDESDGYVRLTARSNFDDSSFSRTDIECLDESITNYADMEFLTLWRRVHQWPPYRAFYRGSGTSTAIPYEEFIPKDMPNRDKIIEQLREHAPATEL